MSYTIEDLTTIDDAVFDALWDASFPRIESGATMLWRKYDAKPLTSDEKKGIIKNIFTMALESGPDSKLYLCRKDGTPIRMFNASVFDSVAVCHYTLYGPDADGSRSWLYDGEVLRQTRDQLTSDFDVTGHTIHVATGSPMHTYYLSRGNEREHSVSETQGNDGISIITFTYTGE
jgi:hypothetical protein|tara:strand:+ start:551 stop:1075 length:525 start_codon:yes stop_codon:yes gene_type:complete